MDQYRNLAGIQSEDWFYWEVLNAFIRFNKEKKTTGIFYMR